MYGIIARLEKFELYLINFLAGEDINIFLIRMRHIANFKISVRVVWLANTCGTNHSGRDVRISTGSLGARAFQ
jgi:hypothetical protein